MTSPPQLPQQPQGLAEISLLAAAPSGLCHAGGGDRSTCGRSVDRVWSASDRVVVSLTELVVRPPVPAPPVNLLVIARHDANKNLLGLLKALATARAPASMARRAANPGSRHCGRRCCRVYVVRCLGLKDLN